MLEWGGCEFRADRSQIALGAAVHHAVITDNLLRGTSRITNQSNGNVIISNYVADGANRGAFKMYTPCMAT